MSSDETRCPKCGGPTEQWEQYGRPQPAIRCINYGHTWNIAPQPMSEKRVAEIRMWHAYWGQSLRSLAIEELLDEVERLRTAS